MDATDIRIGFTDARTAQIRLELGEVIDAAQTTDVPPGATPDPDSGYVWQDGAWLGRVGGPEGQYFQGFDTLVESPLADLFDTTDGRAAVDRPGGWSVTVNGDPVGIDAVSRKSNILDTAETGWFIFDFATTENVFLSLDAPLAPGDVVRIAFDDPDFDPVQVTYAPDDTVSEAVHVNLTGFDPDDLVKAAFLSSWNGVRADGTPVPQAYEPGTGFRVVDATSGETVRTGTIELAQGIDDPTGFSRNFQGTDLYRMDFSDLDAAGTYHVAVDGVGISQTFEIAEDHWDDLFQTSFSGFYHQRSGIALEEPYTDWTRPASLRDVTVLETTVQLQETDEGYDYDTPTPFELFPDATTGAVVEDAWGGWHDAGDWDRRTQHLEASRKLIELVELQPEFAEATDGSIPESGDGVPDLLDEAIWGMEVFRRMQTEDGGIRGGIESATNPQYGDGSWGESLEVYAYAPDVWSSWEYAAAAAKLADALADYDPDAAAGWLTSARAAMDWAEARVPTGADYDFTLANSRNLAAAELYDTTGEARWHDLFRETYTYVDGPNAPDYRAEQLEAAFVYARTEQPGADAALQANGIEALRLDARTVRDVGGTSGFGYQTNAYAPYGWGNTGQQPNHSADTFLRLHALTGEAEWLAVVQADVQYALGANPQNMAYMTGIDAVRSPEEILNVDADTLGKGPPPGITLYGDYSIFDYGRGFYHDIMEDAVYPDYTAVPVAESFNAFSVFVPSAEYTVQQGVTDMTFVTGYLAAEGMAAGGNDPDSDPDPNPDPDPDPDPGSDPGPDPVEETRVKTVGDGRRITLTSVDGTLRERQVEDLGDAFAWAAQTVLYDAGGDVTLRRTLFDDGRTVEATYADGVRTGVVRTNPEPGTPPGDGAGSGADTVTRTVADGRRITLTERDGTLRERLVEDLGDVFPWAVQAVSYDATGQVTLRRSLGDDGVETVLRFEDGVRAEMVARDTADIHDWAERRIVYDEAGAVAARDVIPDPGAGDALLT